MGLRTTIPAFDKLAGGGIPEGSMVVFWSKPGVENVQFVYQTVYSNLKKGYSVLYIVNNKTPSLVRSEISNYINDISQFEVDGKLLFIDSYSKMFNADSGEKLCVDNPKNIDSVMSSIKEGVKRLGAKKLIIVLDDLSTTIDLCGDASVKVLSKWKESFGKATSLFLFTEWPYSKNVLSTIRKSMDIVVKINAVEEKVILRKYFSIDKGIESAKGKGIPFEIVEPGGIKVYIPKILVTGPYNAGKSSFVHSASVKSVSVDRFGTTIALDHGHVDYAGFSIDLFGTPGQERFDPILKLLGGQSLGVIIVIDSTAPETFPRAKEMLKKTRTVGLPFVIAANKANLNGALSVKEIREIFNFGDEVKIIPVRAEKNCPKEGICKLKKGDVHKVLDTLFKLILKI